MLCNATLCIRRAPSGYDQTRIVVKKCILPTLSGITNFIATAIRVVPYIELSFPTYTGPHFNSIEGVRIHWKGQLKQLLRETGNCKGRVLVEFSGRPNYTQPIYQVIVSIYRAI